MTGKLENKTRRALTFNLTTAIAPVRHIFARREEQKDGKVRHVDKRVVLPASVTVLARGTSESLPDGAAGAPEIASAIARGDVRWMPDPVAAPKPVLVPVASADEGAPTKRTLRTGA